MKAVHGGGAAWIGWHSTVAAAMVAGVLAGVVAGGLTGQAAEPTPPPPADGIRLATFDVDATPPMWAALAYGPVVKEGPLTLRCRGTVLLGSGEPIVLAAIDWIGIGNEAHDSFREALADAAGTSADRVAVHALHQHDAPQADLTAEKLLDSLDAQGHDRFRGTFAAGKYTDGSPGNRVTLALRMAAAMRQSYERAIAARTPLSAADVGWGSVPVALEARADLDRRGLEEQVRTKPDRGTFSALDALAFAARAERRHAIPVTSLRVGSSRMLHLPGELFVEFQLAARAMRPDLGVFVAAYGDYGPGSIGTAASYAEGGYEVQPSSSFVGPEAEERLLAAIRTLLMP